MSRDQKIRPPMVAGMFYPQKKLTLEREVAMLLENAMDKHITGKVFSLIVPHAGYLYSGGVAARAYRQIMDTNLDVVVVISPSHREYFKEISIYDGYAYSTPLGNIPVDRVLALELAQIHPQIIVSEVGHRYDEHALEVQLPFLQKVLDKFGDIGPFNNIIYAEQKHSDSLIQIYEKYDLAIPENNWYDKVPEFNSVKEACEAGIIAEIENIALYDDLFSQVDNQDITTIFTSLRDASEYKHLPAFERCATR